MDFESFIKLPTVKQREMEYVRMEFESFEALQRIVENTEKIIKLLEKLNKKE